LLTLLTNSKTSYNYVNLVSDKCHENKFVPIYLCSRFISQTSTNTKSQTPVYLYAMNHAPTGKSCEDYHSNYPERCGYAYHGVDTIFVFQTGPDLG